jgi:hypothetical protein
VFTVDILMVGGCASRLPRGADASAQLLSG